ncbi:MAG TPA: polyketide synthase dehydratase domain-containing protein, partial [Myxococcota bacterium]|nr:polyketide synthase dehydratase domain-containing protein [Myxococcota bacterium]
ARLWPGERAALAELALRDALMLPKSGALSLQVAAECGAHAASLRFAIRTAGSSAAFEPVASCRVVRAAPPAQATPDLDALRARCSEPEEQNDFYAALEASGLAVPKERRALREARYGMDEALAKLSHAAPPAENAPAAPLLLDAALQLLVRLAERAGDDALSRFELAAAEGVALGAASVTSELFAHARLAPRQDSACEDLIGDVALLDSRGEVIAAVTGARIVRSAKPIVPGAGPFLYELAWRPVDAAGTADEPQRALRDGVLCAPRLVPLSLPESAARRAAAGEREFAAEAAEPTRLTGALLRERSPRAPGAGEVALEVKAAGLSFLDVLRSFGLEGDDAPGLGCELAGIVREVGRGVTALRAGDDVFGFAPGALASRVITDARTLLRKPAQLSFEHAAALPLARAVAQHALRQLARVRAGDRVLVHSAGGAIGQAAVALAVRAGAEVAATAGSEAKRASLRAHGAAYVADSRSPRAADDLLAQTGGRLFDVALDLAGDGVPLSVLASGGRFVAMQRTGRANGFDRGPSRRNLSLHSLDPRELLQSKPEELVAALRDSLAEASDSELASPPLCVFPISQLGRAIRFMAQARHEGKVVVSLAQRGEAKLTPLGAGERIASGAVLAFGELGRFPAVAHWLAAQRPRELLCVSEGESLEAASAKLSAPLRAVVFAPSGGSARDAIARAREIVSLASEQGAALTWLLADANAVLEPHAHPDTAKLAGAFSDLARARRASGEPVSALALGALAVTPGAAAQLTRIAQSDVAACILHATAPGAWDPASAPLLRELGAANAPAASKLASASPEERRAKLRELVGAALAIVLRLSAAERARIDWHRPLAELGLDSLMGVELHARIEEAAGIEIPPALLFAEPNLEAVVERISASLAKSA